MEVLDLLQPLRNDRPLLLRYTRAAQLLKQSERVEILQEVLFRSYGRAESHHPRYAAMFHLWFTGDTASALAHAQTNWDQQKEPEDVLIFAEAAARAADPKAEQVIARWIKQHGMTDVRLSQLGRF